MRGDGVSEDDYLHGVDVGIDLYMDRAMKAEATATRRLELLKDLLAMAKHYKPIPEGYPPPMDEDEETWAIGELYSRIEKELADED